MTSKLEFHATCALATVLVGLFSSNALATDFTFTAGADPNELVGDWNEPANWDPPAIPGSSDKATILDGKTVRVQDDDQFAREVVVINTGKIEIIDKTLTLGSASAATVSSGTTGGFIRFKSVTAAPSRLRVHDQTTLQNLFIETDPGVAGEITWAGAKTDSVKLANMNITGSLHFNTNLEFLNGTSFLNVFNAADTMLIGPDADPDPSDATFNNYTATGAFNTARAGVGNLKIQRMDMNGATGEIATGWPAVSGNPSAGTIEIRHYADAPKLTSSTGLSFCVYRGSLLDIKTDVGGQSLKFDGVGSGIARIKVKAAFLARFQDGL